MKLEENLSYQTKESFLLLLHHPESSHTQHVQLTLSSNLFTSFYYLVQATITSCWANIQAYNFVFFPSSAQQDISEMKSYYVAPPTKTFQVFSIAEYITSKLLNIATRVYVTLNIMFPIAQ